MKVIAACTVDFERGALGTRARLEEDLLGETILRRTIRRLLSARQLASIHLLVKASQRQRAEKAVAGLNVNIETHDAQPVPWQSYVATARKWTADAWRGGLAGTCVFDETAHPWLLEALAKKENADGIADIPPAACLIDPALLDDMIEHYAEVHQQVRMTFTQSAPGLSAAIYAPALLADLVATNQWPGRLMAYNPANPARDMVMLPCFYAPQTEVRHAAGRCIADTDTAIERIRSILKNAGTAPDAVTISRMLIDQRFQTTTSLPTEVEIELTTEDSLADTTLRPRGNILGRSASMTTDLFDRLIDELAGRDDIRIVLGGFGDPLTSPHLDHCLQKCRNAEIFGLAVRTPAVNMDDETLNALFDARVDVLNILLDAATADTYRLLHRADHFDRVTANIDRISQMHQTRKQPQPLIVCEMTKTDATLSEMEAFYDHWGSRTGSALIVAPSTYGDQFPDLSVMNMAPPTRTACERIFNRAIILADGRVPLCDQDFVGRHLAGSLADQTLASIWTGQTMRDLRQRHLENNLDTTPLCRPCTQWHRP